MGDSSPACHHLEERESDETLFRRLYKANAKREDETEPMMNIISWRKGENSSAWSSREKSIVRSLFCRRRRPVCGFAGALDMSGLIITPEKDFRKLTEEKALLLQECGVSEEKMT